MLAQGQLDIMNSWQQDRVRTLPDHAETDQHGLFMSLGMGSEVSPALELLLELTASPY